MDTSSDLEDNKAVGRVRKTHHWWQKGGSQFTPPITHDPKKPAETKQRLGAKAKEKNILELTTPKIEEEQDVVDQYDDYIDPETDSN